MDKPTVKELRDEVGFELNEEYEIDTPMILVNAYYTRESDKTIWSIFYTKSGDGNYHGLIDGDVKEDDITYCGKAE